MSAVIDPYARSPGKALVAVGFPVAPAYGLEDFDAGIRDQRVHTLEVAAAFTGVELARLTPFTGKSRDAPADLLAYVAHLVAALGPNIETFGRNTRPSSECSR